MGISLQPLSAILRPFSGNIWPHKSRQRGSRLNSKERFWSMHSVNPARHWIMVYEEATGKLVGASQWLINKKNCFPNGPAKIVASWWPEGSVGREFASQMLTQAYTPRGAWMRRPCVVLNIMSTHPLYRRRGVGSLMMAFGESSAKELQLECWTEASYSGRFLYEKFGYKMLLKYSLDAARAEMSDEWRRLAHEYLPQEVYAMWKPEGGVFTDETVLPWDRGVVS